MTFKHYLEEEDDKPYFTTNSLGYYYDKMEGFAEKVEQAAKILNVTKEEVEKNITAYIEQNKNELDQRLAEWDGKLETFDGKLETFDSSVETLLTEWVDDGTLNNIIDSTLIDQKIAPVTAKLTETEVQLDSQQWIRTPVHNGGPGSFPNVIGGFSGSGIASDIVGAVVFAGTQGNENVIGGDTATVGTTTPNKPIVLGTGAHYAGILAGYDNVNNGLASVITGYHCSIEKEATHGGILSGSYHKIIDGDYSNINGGTGNTIKGEDTNSGVISGGTQNVLDIARTSAIGGGTANVITNSQYATIAGGSGNKVTGSNGAGVLGGNNQTITNGGSSVVAGGTSNAVNASFSSIMGGLLNTVALGAQYSIIMGGRENSVNAMYAVASGRQAKAHIVGSTVQADTAFSTPGDAQKTSFTLKQTLSNAIGQRLSTSLGVSPVIQVNSVVTLKALVVMKRTDVAGEYAGFEILGTFARQANGTTIAVGTPTITKTGASENAVTWNVAVDASSADGAVVIRASGEDAKTIRVVASVEMVEVI